MLSAIRVVREREPGKVAIGLFYDHDTEAAAEVLFANCARFLMYAGGSSTARELADLDTLSSALDSMSDAAVYDDAQRANFFSDGTNTDKGILFTIQFEVPLRAVSRQVRCQSKRYAAPPTFEIPLLQVRNAIETSRAALAFYDRHEYVDHWHRSTPLRALEIREIEAETPTLGRSHSVAMRLADLSNVLIGRLYGGALRQLWKETVAVFRKRVVNFASLPYSIRRIVQLVLRAHECGIGVEALAWLCIWRLRVDGMPLDGLTLPTMVAAGEMILQSHCDDDDSVAVVESAKKKARKSVGGQKSDS